VWRNRNKGIGNVLFGAAMHDRERSVELLERIISARLSFHAVETELQREFQPRESLLPEAAARKLATSGLTCYGIEEDVLRFIADSVGEGSRTLETGAGCSTLVFAIRKAQHTAITPSETEIRLIREYAGDNDIVLAGVRFVSQPSELYLPQCDESNLDLVLLDGKHAFPWPIVDWFFTADRLKRGGLMLLDDAKMRSVAVLTEFMAAEPGWQFVRSFSTGKTLAFRKVQDKILDVAWHMQPWTVNYKSLGILRRIRARMSRILRGV
jgi:predicted O-methyltransferase YrrM